MTTTAIIISGTVDMPVANVGPALEEARPLIEGALAEQGCLDYDWCPDPRVPGRIRVFERWATQADLHTHLNDKWYFDMRDCLGKYGITAGVTAKYRVDKEEPVYDETGVARAEFFS